jgi:IS605 OrfB family transposase
LGRGATTKEIDQAIHADENFSFLQSNSAQAVRRTLQHNLSSFFEALEGWKKHPEKYMGRPQFPQYLPSLEKRVIEIYQVPKIKDGYWSLPMSQECKDKFGPLRIRLPKNLREKKIKYIEIVPRHNGRFFEVHYTHEQPVTQMKKQVQSTNLLTIDLGVTNFLSCITNLGDSFILDGRRIKSINQFFNKQAGKLQKQNKQHGLSPKVCTKKQATLWTKRDRKLHGYMTWALGILFKKVKEYQIGTIVVGKNKFWKQEANLYYKKNTQNFVDIPFNRMLDMIRNRCRKEGIVYIEQEESYTSKSSFFDNDVLPVFDVKKQGSYTFSGRRIKRGLYKSKEGIVLNSDIHGALNILRKAGLFPSQPMKLAPPVVLKRNDKPCELHEKPPGKKKPRRKPRKKRNGNS